MPELTRRQLLVATAIGPLLAACTSSPTPTPPPHDPDADERARAGAARAEAQLADEYDAAIGAHPPLAARLAPLRDHHRRHVDALVVAPRASTSPSASASAAPTPAPVAVVLLSLGARERDLQRAHLAALPAVSPELAMLLASLSAAAAAHAAELARR